MDRRHFLAALAGRVPGRLGDGRDGQEGDRAQDQGRDADEPHRPVVVRALHRQRRRLERAQAAGKLGVRLPRRFSADGKSIVFTSERNGDGQSDLFRCNLDGTGISRSSSVPRSTTPASCRRTATRLAFVSTRQGYRTNIWVQDLKSGA
jgi:hypothetical protein